MAQEPALEVVTEEESLPMAPQAFDGFSGVPQAAFAPRDGEVVVRKPASAFVGPAKPKPRKAVKTTRKALKNLNVSR